MKQAHGNWVVGDRFWDRKADVDLFIQRIEEGAHILLVAQRRMGKTSLMHEVARQLKGRYLCIFIDFQKFTNAADVIVELSLATYPHKSLWEKSVGIFSNILDKLKESIESVEITEIGIKFRAGLTNSNWVTKGGQLFSILADSETKVILLLDEVPIFVNRVLKDENGAISVDGRKQADVFMSWLRDNSIRHKGKVNIVLSGSIGIEPVLKQANLSASLNTFVPLELNAWDEETAIGCLNTLAVEYGVRFGEGATTEMVRRLGCCIPHHVQMFFTHVYDRCKRRGRMDFFRDEVEEVYNNEMLSVRGHAELTHYEERLKLVLGSERLQLALEMLTEAAVVGMLTKEALAALEKIYVFSDKTSKQVQQEILYVLEHDGYLVKSGEKYIFVSKLVQDWWRRRYESFFTPISERSV